MSDYKSSHQKPIVPNGKYSSVPVMHPEHADTAAIPKVENPGKVDEPKWEKAKEASEKSYGKVKWPVVTSIYKEMGGTFQKKK